MTKLAIETPSDESQFEYSTVLKCLLCGDLDASVIESKGLTKNAEAIMSAISAKKKQEMKAWEDETVQTCYHTNELVQDGEKVLGRNLAHCNACELNDNLWLCLTCGSLGCGRSQYGGVGGNGHGVAHFETTGHPLAVKMGSITPEGTAGIIYYVLYVDIFCYEHGNEVLDPSLGIHLAKFGINISSQEKTEKSIAELVHHGILII